MDNSANSSNDSMPLVWRATKDQILEQFGSIWPLDSIYLFVITPLGLIGFLLNLLCFYILKHNDFSKVNIYGYFKIININSALLCLIQSTLFISLTYRYFEFSNTNETNLYSTMVYLPVSNKPFGHLH